MSRTIELTWDNEDGEEIIESFPAKNEICDRCEGYGNHLNPSIGEHAYSMEEFNESFDEEEREQYFKRGGIYDVQCEECHGNKVVPVVDENRLSEAQKKLYAEFELWDQERARSDAEDRATYRMESGYQE